MKVNGLRDGDLNWLWIMDSGEFGISSIESL